MSTHVFSVMPKMMSLHLSIFYTSIDISTLTETDEEDWRKPFPNFHIINVELETFEVISCLP